MIKWTPELCTELLRLRVTNSITQTAKLLGVSRGTVSGKFARLAGYARPQKPVQRVDRRIPPRHNNIFEPYSVFKARKIAERAACR